MGHARLVARPVAPGCHRRKPLRMLAGNATTRQREPAGHSRGESLLSEKLVEAGGIEPPSRGISAAASTCVVRLLVFLGPRDSGGQDSCQARAGQNQVPLGPARRKTAGSLLWSSNPAPQAEPVGRRRQLSGESVVRFGTYGFCRVFYEASRQPRHAATASTCPVDTIRPRTDWVRYRPDAHTGRSFLLYSLRMGLANGNPSEIRPELDSAVTSPRVQEMIGAMSLFPFTRAPLQVIQTCAS